MKKLFHFRPIFYGFVFLLLGIMFAGRIFTGDFEAILTVLLLFTVTIVLTCHFKVLKRLMFLCMAFMVGLGMFYIGLAGFTGRTFEGEVTISGRVQDGYADGGTYYRLVLDSVVVNGEHERNVNVYIYKTTAEQFFETGDILTFKTTVKNVELISEEGLFTPYLRNNTPYTANVSENKVTIDSGSMTISEALRENIKNLLDENMSQQGAALAYASLFGDKSFVDDSIYSIFNNAGLLHLLAVSGLHVGFFILILNFVLSKCKVKRLPAFLITGAVLLFYAILCSFSPSVLRASIMCLVVLGARLCGKEYDGLNSLGFAGLLILLVSPLSALDNGFLMSVACVFAIFALYKPMVNFFSKFLIKPIASGAALTIAAQLGVIPFLAEFYGTVNFLSIFANVLLVPIFGVMFILLFISVCICLIMPFMGFILYAADFMIWLVIWIATFFASAKIFTITLSPLREIVKMFIYAAMFVLSGFLMTGKKLKLGLLSVFTLFFITFLIS